MDTEEKINEAESVDEVKNTENLKTKSAAKIKYNGQVTVSIVNNNKQVLSKKVYHNAGGNKMFEFLCNCIAGGSNLTNLRPQKIKLIFNKAEKPDSVYTGTDDQYKSYSNCISANKGNTLKTNVYGQSGKVWTANLHFLIPNAYLLVDGTDEAVVNEIRLYPNNTIVDDEDTDSAIATTDFAAKFQFTTLNAEGELVWDPINIKSIRNNYNIIIDWTIYFSNN